MIPIAAVARAIDELHFFYYAQSKPAFVEYGGTKYRYTHNLQGDIVAVVDPLGNPVVEYQYDAWGKPTHEEGEMLGTLGKLNPFRYRGYVWDTETGLYYVSTRYLNSTLCRWLNLDIIIPENGKLLEYNLFEYCLNNPISMIDSQGEWPRWITAAVSVAATAVAVVTSAPIAAVVAVSAAVLYEMQVFHYDHRASKNKNIPLLYDVAVALPGVIDEEIRADCHQFTATDGPNRKVCWSDGREAIYDCEGILITDPRDIGTYNYATPIDWKSKIAHARYDVLPWIIFGNSDDDWGIIYGSIKRFETSGQISLLSLTKLCVALDCVDEIKKLFTNVEYRSIEEVLRETTYVEMSQMRKRV